MGLICSDLLCSSSQKYNNNNNLKHTIASNKIFCFELDYIAIYARAQHASP
jgi:hypothetical protein